MKYETEVLEKSRLSKLKPLVMNNKFTPYQEYGVPKERLANYVLDEVNDALSSENSIVLACEEKGELIGLVLATKLEWDTKHFGLEMARIKHLLADGEYSKSLDVKSALLSGLLAESSQKHFEHLTVGVHTEDISSIHALESKSFRMTDTLVSYGLDLRKDHLIEFKNSCHVREFRQSDIDTLKRIALETFKSGRIATDRFHADPSLSKEKSDELYVEWIVNSCRGLADAVLVAEIDGIIVGYITCKVFETENQRLGKRFGSMIISAVSPSVRRKGVYSSLFNSGLHWLAERVDVVEIGTQIGNYAVQKVWPKFGFALTRSQYSFAYSTKLPTKLAKGDTN